jgi:hypothetical protein
MEPSSKIPLTVSRARVGVDEGDGERERVQPQQAEGEPQRHPQALSAAAHWVCVDSELQSTELQEGDGEIQAQWRQQR